MIGMIFIEIELFVHVIYRVEVNKSSCLNKHAPALSGTKTIENGCKMCRVAEKRVLFLPTPWTHLGICLHAGRVDSELCGILQLTCTVSSASQLKNISGHKNDFGRKHATDL